MTFKQIFRVILAIFLLTLVALVVIDAELRVPSAPRGIVSFEFCGFRSSCETILAEWGAQGQQLAMLSLGLDYLFLVLYPTLICISLLRAARHLPSALAGVTVLLAWLALGAGVADAAENYALIQVVIRKAAEPYGWFGAMLAAAKFLIFGTTLTWFLFVAVYVRMRRKGAEDEGARG